MKFENIIKLKLNNFEIKPPTKMADKEMENPCWEGYEPYGTKEVDGKEVPNCVPIKAQKMDDATKTAPEYDFVIPTPESGEKESDYISRCMSAIADEYDTQEQALAVCYAQLKK